MLSTYRFKLFPSIGGFLMLCNVNKGDWVAVNPTLPFFFLAGHMNRSLSVSECVGDPPRSNKSHLLTMCAAHTTEQRQGSVHSTSPCTHPGNVGEILGALCKESFSEEPDGGKTRLPLCHLGSLVTAVCHFICVLRIPWNGVGSRYVCSSNTESLHCLKAAPQGASLIQLTRCP